MKRASPAFRVNKRLAEHSWGRLSSRLVTSLRSLTSEFGLSIGKGDIICLDEHWYITHSGLLRLASRRRCAGIHVEMVRDFCDPASARWAFKATVFPSDKSTGFVGFGDADPSNVSPLVRGAEMRVAETRAVNRALRKAYGIGLCSVEEIGSARNPTEKLPPQNANGNGNGSGPKVRDRLCQLIRQHKLDPELVKAYAVVDEKALPGLRGVVKISHVVVNGILLVNLDGFAPASQWEELSAAPVSTASRNNTAEASR